MSTSGSTSVLGAGGHAKVVIATLQAAQRIVVAIYDDDVAKTSDSILGVPVRGTLSDAATSCHAAVIAIGRNDVRRHVASLLALHWDQVVHPYAFVHSSVEIHRGVVVFAGAMVQPDSVLGEHVIINTGARIDHDCRVGSFAHVAPGAILTGNVTVGELAFVGAGAVITPGRKIGRGAIVGAGAVVVEDVPDFAVVRGVPARVTRYVSPFDS